MPKIIRKLTDTQEKFVQYYGDPTSETFGQGTASAKRAGYSCPQQSASRTLSLPHVQHALKKYKARIRDKEALTIQRLQDEYWGLYEEARAENDRANARACLHDLTKTVGGFLDVSQTTVKTEIEEIPEEERLELERLARRAAFKASS